MKRTAWMVASSFGVLGLANATLACFSSTSATPPEYDSGTRPQADANPFAEDTGTPSRDGGRPPTDAGADTTVVDAGPEPLKLTVLLLGAPEPGVNVVFQDDTGAVVTTATTGTDGTVTQFVTAGSQVTALLGSPQAPNLVTIQGVAPGDALTMVDTPSNSPPQGENVTVTLPAAAWDAAGTAEEVYAGSCYNPPSYPLYLSSRCETAGQFPLLARAVDSTSQQEIAYTYQLGNVAQPEGGLPDGETSLPIAITLPWATSTATATLTSTNPPGLPDDGGTTSTADGVSLAYYEVAEGVPLSVPPDPADTTDDGGTLSNGFVMHPGYPDFVQGDAFDLFNTPIGIVVAGVATRAAPQATSLAMSFDLSTLPLITATSIETTDGGTTSQPNVTWTSTGSLSAADGIYVSAQWFSSAATEAGTVYVDGTWTILAPPTATNVRAPALPASLAAWAPSATASFNSRPRMGAIQASFVTGYAGFRAQFGGLSILSGYEIVLPTLPVNGTVHLVGIYQDEG
jgi:hypothetical protein